VAHHRGRIVKLMGDGVLLEFAVLKLTTLVNVRLDGNHSAGPHLSCDQQARRSHDCEFVDR
jgi:class 3 adenylate cyclase